MKEKYGILNIVFSGMIILLCILAITVDIISPTALPITEKHINMKHLIIIQDMKTGVKTRYYYPQDTTKLMNDVDYEILKAVIGMSKK